MRQYRSPDGEQRLWYDESEIEQIMQDELRRGELAPTTTTPAVDVEAFLEQHLRVTLDHYADLDADVLGLTEFGAGRVPHVRINKDLTGSALDDEWCPPGVEGRWRATLAHEAAHVVLHRVLFEFDEHQQTLIDLAPISTPDQRMFRCLKRELSYRRSYDWREVQANRGMAALLMPKRFFERAARRAGANGSGTDLDTATRRLAAEFGVSRQAVTIRLRTLGFIRDDDAEALFAASD